MNKKKPFMVGLAVGMAVMLALSFGFGPVKSYIQWGSFRTPDAKIREIFALLDAHSIDVYDRQLLLESMYRGLLDGVGDPYTYYFDQQALEAFTERTEGTYAGIGMLVTTDVESRLVSVVTVFPGSPCENAGLLPGDLILEVNGDSVFGKQLEEVTAVTKGTPGTSVTLTVFRESENRNFSVDIVRQIIDVPTVSHRMLDDEIGYLRIDTFDRVTYSQFVDAYKDLLLENMNGMILDLRNNPGGLLDVVTDIGKILLPAGIITYTEDKQGNRREYLSDGLYQRLPLVVLVNEGSASASEVLTGAVKDMGVGTIVGQKTFGKGIVQSLYHLTDGSAIKVTIAKYYTPSGVCIQGEGIVPDVVVEVDRETSVNAARLTLEEDVQLQRAMEVMREKFN